MVLSRPMPVTCVRNLTPADVDRAAEVLQHAFAADPALLWLLPDPEHRAAVQPVLARAFIHYAMNHGVAWCTPDVDGVALRRPPGQEHLHWLGILASGMAWLPLHLGWEATGRLLQVEADTSRRHAAAVQGPHWYLWTVAVDPERQGDGLGGALMKHTFEQADGAGLPCYLETTSPRARAIHQAHGFHVVEQTVVDDSLTIWAMVRTPA